MIFFEKGELKLLWPFYLSAFLSGLFFIYPAFYIIQLQQILTLTQIGFLITALSFSSFIFEIPTGAIADIFGRKFSVLLGYFLQGFSLIFISITTNFYLLLIAFFLYGIFGTFVSGADISWSTDNLLFKKRKNLISNFFIKEQSFNKLSLIFSGFIGTILVLKLGLNIIWFVSSLSFFFAGFVLIFIPEHRLTKEKKKTFSRFLNKSKESIKYSIKNKFILYLLVALFFVSFFTVARGNISWQPLLEESGFPIYYLGILFSIIAFFGIIAPYFAKPLIKKIGKTNIFLSVIIIAQAFISFLILFSKSWIFEIFIMVFLYFIFDLYNPIRKSYYQNFIPSKMRATINSFSATILALAFVLSAPLTGLLIDNFGPRTTIAISSLFLIPAFILYLKIKDRN